MRQTTADSAQRESMLRTNIFGARRHGLCESRRQLGGGMRASKNAMAANCKDVLWLDAAEHKYVEEIGTSNAFFRIGDDVYTASLDSGTILARHYERFRYPTSLKKWGITVHEGNCPSTTLLKRRRTEHSKKSLLRARRR